MFGGDSLYILIKLTGTLYMLVRYTLLRQGKPRKLWVMRSYTIKKKQDNKKNSEWRASLRLAKIPFKQIYRSIASVNNRRRRLVDCKLYVANSRPTTALDIFKRCLHHSLTFHAVQLAAMSLTSRLPLCKTSTEISIWCAYDDPQNINFVTKSLTPITKVPLHFTAFSYIM